MKPRPSRNTPHASFIPSGRTWIFLFFGAVILAGSLALLLPGMWLGPEPLSPVDALFTATSAVCVTGLIVVDTARFSMAGQTVILALIQVGGLGVITVIMVFVVSGGGVLSLRQRKLLGDYFLPSVEHRPGSMVLKILGYALAFELLVTLILWPQFAEADVPDSFFAALFHSVSAFCNAGFSTFSNSLESWVAMPSVVGPLTLLIIVGGLGFVALDDVRHRLLGGARHLRLHTKIVLWSTFALLLLGAAGFALSEWQGALAKAGDNPFLRIWESFVMSVMPRTAGFDTIAPAALSQGGILLTIILMVIGGAPASTAGGLKITTVAILLLATLRGIDADANLGFRHRRIPPTDIARAAMLLVRYVVLAALLLLALVWVESQPGASGASLTTLCFELISALSTVGLSLGVTASLGTAGKLVIIAAMYLGRIGILALVLPSNNRSRKRAWMLPHEEVLTG